MRRRLLVVAKVVAALAALTVLGSAWWIGTHLRQPGYVHRTPEQGLHPRTDPPYAPRHWMGHFGDPTSEFGLAFREVEFPAVDGSTLRGWLVPGPGENGLAVVTAHGGEVDRRGFLRQLPMLHRAGYAVLLFDYREHGISDGAGRGMAFGWREHHDVSSAVRYMKQEAGYARVAVFGTSMGGASAIVAGGLDDAIDVVVAENPFASASDVLGEAELFDRLPAWYRVLTLGCLRLRYGLWSEPDAIDVVDRISPRPLLLLHGTSDDLVGVWQSERLYERAGDPKAIWILEGAEHTALFNLAPAEYERRVIGFLERHLPGAASAGM